MGAPFGIAIFNVIAISTNGNSGDQVRGGPQLMKGYKNALFGIATLGVLCFCLTLFLLPWDKSNVPAKKTAETAAVTELPVETFEEIMEGDLELGALVAEMPKFELEISTIPSEKILDRVP